MPYPGVPASQTNKMEDCVSKVMKQGHSKSSAIAICHDSITKEAGDSPSEVYVHGPGGVLSAPGQTGKRKKKKVTNVMITPKEFVEKYKVAEKDFSYAQAETWVVSDASNALSYLMSVARQEMYMAEQDDSREIVRLMKDLSVFISDQIDEMDSAIAGDVTDMIMYKDAQSQFLTTKEGEQYRWTLITGSAFEDRDGEIISEKAFNNDCDQMELTGDYGELLWWHCDGTQHATDKEARPYIPLGICDTSFVVDKCNIESGLYYDPAIGKVFSEKASKYGASKSFYHKEEEPIDGVYTYIRTKERSLLPRGKEANLLTKLFGLSKEKEMATNNERVDAFAKEAGLETKEEALKLAKELSAKAESYGLKNKDAKTDAKEDAADKGDDKGAKGEMPTKKEFEVQLALATKEVEEKYTLALKEQKDAFDKVVLTLKETTEKQAADIAQLQGGLATLLGFQPKGANKFVASESKDTVKKELTVDEKLKEKQALGFGGDVTSWIISGERQVAA